MCGKASPYRSACLIEGYLTESRRKVIDLPHIKRQSRETGPAIKGGSSPREAHNAKINLSGDNYRNGTCCHSFFETTSASRGPTTRRADARTDRAAQPTRTGTRIRCHCRAQADDSDA